MAESTALVQLGGICGILFGILLMAGLFATRPDVPDDNLSTQRVLNYLNNRQDMLVAGNGLSFILATFFLWLLGALHSALYIAEGQKTGKKKRLRDPQRRPERLLGPLVGSSSGWVGSYY